MSVESANAFMERMKRDSDFASRMTEAQSKEDRWEIAKAEGFCFTEEEFTAVFNPYDARVSASGLTEHTTIEDCLPESCCS